MNGCEQHLVVSRAARALDSDSKYRSEVLARGKEEREAGLVHHCRLQVLARERNERA